ncbi:unnamed protein product, partial [Phaeothamnion confervicola]
EARQAEETSFAYVYCPEPDQTEHAVGFAHPDVGAVLHRLDAELERLWRATEGLRGRKVVVTADHG